MSQSAEVVHVSLEQLKSHPKNPRIVPREDVIESIAHQIQEDGGTFPIEHALLVRKNEEHFEILSGHQRAEAARKCGLKEVPCWVREFDDDAAFMQLVLSNAQGELKPLEIGVHALNAVPKEEGGRGKKGGLSEYAAKIGKPKQDVSTLIHAAEVFKEVKLSEYSDGLLKKAFHLAAIHALSREIWELFVSTLLEKKWSVEDTKYWVSKTKEFEEILFSSQWRRVFLFPGDVIEYFLKTKEFSARTVAALIARADAIVATIDSFENLDEGKKDQYKKEFTAWLSENSGKDSWDLRKIEKFERELMAKIEASIQALDSCWILGDWKDHFKEVKDGSISVLLTDPPYGADYQSDYRLDRRQQRKNKKIEKDTIEKAIGEMKECFLSFSPKMKENSHLFCFCNWRNEPLVRNAIMEAGFSIRGSLIWAKNNTGMGDPKTTFAPKHERIIHAVKGSPILFDRQPDLLSFSRVDSERHPTEKPTKLLSLLIQTSSVEGELIADPFGGVASTLVAAQELQRKFWGCEIDEAYHSTGRGRLNEI